jgi:predicted RNA-binding protein YlxR (DUF448 family)
MRRAERHPLTTPTETKNPEMYMATPNNPRPEQSSEADAHRGPVRTCVGCRHAASPSELVRLVSDAQGNVALDAKSSRGGRGAWVHPTRSCIEATVKRHSAERTLKIDVKRDLDAGALLAALRESLTRKAASLLVVASRTKTLAIGAEAVAASLERTRVPAVVVARDAGSVAKAMAEEGSGGGTRVLRHSTKSELGSLFHRGEVALLALLDTRIAAELAVTIDRLAALED